MGIPGDFEFGQIFEPVCVSGKIFVDLSLGL